MDENFENIILDEEDDLEFKVESLREKSQRNNNNKKNLNKDVINILSNEEDHMKPITVQNLNKKIKNYEEDKELSEEYNDFEYNIEEKIDSGDKSPNKPKNFQKAPFVIDENNNLYGSSSNSNDKIENNLNISTGREINNNIDNNNIDNNNIDNNIDNNNIDNNNIDNNIIDNNIIDNNGNLNEEKESNTVNEKYNHIENEEKENIINDNNNEQSIKEESDKEKIDENNENDLKMNKEKELIKKSSSVIQLIEDNYYMTKNELESILSILEFNSVKEISNQNKRLIDYISKLNSIMNSITKIFPKGEKLLSEKISQNKRINREQETKEDKEKKIVGIYRREYLRLENKYQLIKDPLYKESLLIELEKLEKEYEQLYEENNILREEQRKNELSIERKTKNSTKEKTEVKRLEMDIDNIKSQINLIQKKVDKNKITIIENNKRINQYVEKEKNLDYIAKEKYGIKEYQDIHLKEENKLKMIENKNNLMRKIEIYEKGIETNKNKYEREIRENETIINDLETEKLNLIYHYKELIGDEEFHNIIQNFKKEYNFENENIKEIKSEKESNKEIKSDIKIEADESKEDSEKEKINTSINDNIKKDENILLLKENQNQNNNNEINNSNKKYPEFLDFFKDEENEENDDIKEINNNSEGNKEIKEEEDDNKDEKEIKIVKFEEMNSLRNEEKEEKEEKEETPPNEYEDLEEFQI